LRKRYAEANRIHLAVLALLGLRECGTRLANCVCNAGADHMPVLLVHSHHSSGV